MTKNSKTVALATIAAAVLVTVVFVVRDLLPPLQKTVTCPDGRHPTIDIRKFTNQYWAYSVKLEASVADKAKVSTELNPKTIEQISEALQEAKDFRLYVVAGYNSCAISPAQYSQLEDKFKSLDSVAREINSLISQPSLSPDENKKLAGLIGQYGELARQRGSQ